MVDLVKLNRYSLSRFLSSSHWSFPLITELARPSAIYSASRLPAECPNGHRRPLNLYSYIHHLSLVIYVSTSLLCSGSGGGVLSPQRHIES